MLYRLSWKRHLLRIISLALSTRSHTPCSCVAQYRLLYGSQGYELAIYSNLIAMSPTLSLSLSCCLAAGDAAMLLLMPAAAAADAAASLPAASLPLQLLPHSLASPNPNL